MCIDLLKYNEAVVMKRNSSTYVSGKHEYMKVG